MQSKKIETLFTNFIIKLVGPNEERENERNLKYTLVKKIIEDFLIVQYPDYIPYIFLYGSFPLKNYLKDSDMDITIIFENKIDHKIILDLSQDIINEILSKIKDSFENYNKKNNQTLFYDINIINANIKLLKCQIQSIPLDISINNFFGLLKIIFMNNIFNQIEKTFKNKNEENNNLEVNNKLIIFKRTIILIKAWCTYEGSLMGSNIGLMASYGLEILILYMFNLYYKDINNEIEGFFYFFNLMKNVDIENNIFSIFGLIPINEFHSKFFISEKDKNNIGSEPFWYINNDEKKNDNYLFNLKEIKEILIKINNSPINISINNNKNKEEILFKKSFTEKLFNILDPIKLENNLGKSINYHSFSKMKGVLKYITKEFNNIIEIKKKEDPFLYINSLLKLFYNTLSMNFIELFINYLNIPKISIDSNSQNENINNNNGFTLLRVNREDIKKFNKLFLNQQPDIQNIDNDKKNNNDDDIQDNYEEYEEEEDDESIEENDLGKKEGEGEGAININGIPNNNIKQKKENEIKYENYDLIINNEILNKFFELNSNKNNYDIMSFYENLNKASNEHFLDIEKFLVKYNLI